MFFIIENNENVLINEKFVTSVKVEKSLYSNKLLFKINMTNEVHYIEYTAENYFRLRNGLPFTAYDGRKNSFTGHLLEEDFPEYSPI